MTTERDLGQPDEPAKPSRLPRAVLVWTIAAALGLIAWFLFAWLVLGRHLLDAAGESVGSALLLLIIVSVIGANWRDASR